MTCVRFSSHRRHLCSWLLPTLDFISAPQTFTLGPSSADRLRFKSLVSDSLVEDVRPSSPDKVPRQRLTNHVLGDVDDGGGSILLPDLG